MARGARAWLRRADGGPHLTDLELHWDATGGLGHILLLLSAPLPAVTANSA